MKPHPRIRKTIKWSGAVVTVLLVLVWIGSGWWQISWMSRHGLSVFVGGGCVGGLVSLTDVTMSDSQRGFRLRTNPRYIQTTQTWKFYYRKSRAGDLVLASAPLWIPAITCLAASVWAWRLDTLARRRERLNLCPKCNYDRTGIAAGVVCPECGAIPVKV